MQNIAPAPIVPVVPAGATGEEANGGSSLIRRGVRFLLQGLGSRSGGWGEVNEEEEGKEEEEEEEEICHDP
ncbi:hypothetical protein FRC10_010177 [Ceratobasidium sp. 414]|nr:hypothetical protein FRC10_010177 [Ceratobasidium sp. 414]